jgi:2-hydroxy-6-oxonona-2,4-dienedioate hydrolase
MLRFVYKYMRRIKKSIENKWTQMAGYTLRYRMPRELSVPDSSIIVMLHGLIVSSRYLIPTAKQLAPHYQIYIPELPGFGKSGKPDHYQDLDEMADTLASWMTMVGISEAILLGNSLGCQIIAHFAVRYPERIQAAILVSPTMDARARTAHQEIGRWLLNAFCEPLSIYPLVLRDARDIGFRRVMATFQYGLQDKIEANLPQMHFPTLIVRGSRDTIVPQYWAEYVTSLLPQGNLVVIEHAAHDVNYNSPVELTKTIRRFLNGCSL